MTLDELKRDYIQALIDRMRMTQSLDFDLCDRIERCFWALESRPSLIDGTVGEERPAELLALPAALAEPSTDNDERETPGSTVTFNADSGSNYEEPKSQPFALPEALAEPAHNIGANPPKELETSTEPEPEPAPQAAAIAQIIERERDPQAFTLGRPLHRKTTSPEPREKPKSFAAAVTQVLFDAYPNSLQFGELRDGGNALFGSAKPSKDVAALLAREPLKSKVERPARGEYRFKAELVPHISNVTAMAERLYGAWHIANLKQSLPDFTAWLTEVWDDSKPAPQFADWHVRFRQQSA